MTYGSTGQNITVGFLTFVRRNHTYGHSVNITNSYLQRFSKTINRKRGLCTHSVIPRGMDAALRALVTARQLKSRWTEVVDVYFQLLCGCTQLLSSHRQSYEHTCLRRLTVQYCRKPLYCGLETLHSGHYF